MTKDKERKKATVTKQDQNRKRREQYQQAAQAERGRIVDPDLKVNGVQEVVDAAIFDRQNGNDMYGWGIALGGNSVSGFVQDTRRAHPYLIVDFDEAGQLRTPNGTVIFYGLFRYPVLTETARKLRARGATFSPQRHWTGYEQRVGEVLGVPFVGVRVYNSIDETLGPADKAAFGTRPVHLGALAQSYGRKPLTGLLEQIYMSCVGQVRDAREAAIRSKIFQRQLDDLRKKPEPTPGLFGSRGRYDP